MNHDLKEWKNKDLWLILFNLIKISFSEIWFCEISLQSKIIYRYIHSHPLIEIFTKSNSFSLSLFQLHPLSLKNQIIGNFYISILFFFLQKNGEKMRIQNNEKFYKKMIKKQYIKKCKKLIFFLLVVYFITVWNENFEGLANIKW